MADVLPSDELTDEPSDFGSLRPGTRLGRYELLVPIARGGMARVWAARQHGTRGFQKLVAIKTILPHLAEEPEFERMFLDEARIASGVHHPNVCEIYELGEEKRTLYLAMEWVGGDSLSRVLRASGKTEALDPRVMARVVADACAGVHAAHELTDEDGRQLGVVHRDMSPHNVLLTTDGVAKVCDFGVAKALGQLHEQTSAGQLKGKISYMSPEQVTGAAIDRRSDVFSLGCVLYEATTGVRPFKGDRDHMIMHAILNSELEPPTSIIRSYPPELERIVLRALAHQPILRYPTAERMRFALEEFLTRGQLVTQSNVAQVVRSRIGELLEKRKERIKLASTASEQGAWDPSSGTPSRDAQDHRSGVKPSRPLSMTMQMPEAAPLTMAPGTVSPPTPRMGTPAATGLQGPPQPGAIAVADNDATIHGHGLPASSPTIPQIPAARAYVQHAENSQHGPNPMGGPTLTLPIGAQTPSHLRPPVTTTANGPSEHYSSPGHAPDWSHPHQVGSPLGMPPSTGPTSNPYGNTAIYDVAGNVLPPELQHRAEAEPQAPAGAGQYAIAAFVGLLFAVAIGGGTFYLWHARTSAAVVAPAPQATAPSAAPSTPPAPAPAAAEIAFKITPATAILVVDGQELAAAQRSVPRPPAGRTVSVLVRAKDFEDASLQIDYFTTAPVEIVLKPLLEIDALGVSAAPDGAAPAGSDAPAGSAKPHLKPRPKDPSALPDNPY